MQEALVTSSLNQAYIFSRSDCKEQLCQLGTRCWCFKEIPGMSKAPFWDQLRMELMYTAYSACSQNTATIIILILCQQLNCQALEFNIVGLYKYLIQVFFFPPTSNCELNWFVSTIQSDILNWIKLAHQIKLTQLIKSN